MINKKHWVVVFPAWPRAAASESAVAPWSPVLLAMRRGSARRSNSWATDFWRPHEKHIGNMLDIRLRDKTKGRPTKNKTWNFGSISTWEFVGVKNGWDRVGRGPTYSLLRFLLRTDTWEPVLCKKQYFSYRNHVFAKLIIFHHQHRLFPPAWPFPTVMMLFHQHDPFLPAQNYHQGVP